MINQPRQRVSTVVVPYNAADPPVTGDLQAWIRAEHVKIEQSIAALNRAAVQVAYGAPANPTAGMVRLAQGGWNPTSLSGYNAAIGQLVVYVNGNWVAANSI